MEANPERTGQETSEDDPNSGYPYEADLLLSGELVGDGEAELRKSYTVCILFTPDLAPCIAQIEWFYDQRVIIHENGAAELRFNAGSLAGLERWVLGWGPSAVALKPNELREKVVAAARAIFEKHSEEPVE